MQTSLPSASSSPPHSTERAADLSLRLDGSRVFLREFTEDDLDAVHDYERDDEAMRFQTSGPRSRDESLSYIRRSIACATESPRTAIDLAIIERSPSSDAQSPADRDVGTLIGRAGFGIDSLEHAEAKLWYILRRDRWGEGLAAEASALLIDHAFRALAMHRVFVDIDPRNAGSVRVAEKLGMKREGLLRENFRCKGEWTDSLILGILDREWLTRSR